jgi:glycosyltransferase involved in cell wall biosynthesis
MTKWICHQLGSREHYSIPRALEQQGRLERLQTDAWVRPNHQWLPRLLGQPALASRYHPELSTAKVEAFTFGRLHFDLKAKIRNRNEWTTIAERDRWFQQQCLHQLMQTLNAAPDTVVFSYAYTARDLFKSAKKQGARCILGQVDPGPAEFDWLREVLPMAIAAQVKNRPSEYWASWREEVALADHILVNSPWSKELLVTRTGLPEEKIVVIPLAYEPSRRARQSREYPAKFTQARPLKLLFLGQIIHRKGVHLLLEAMQSLQGQPVQLDLVGPIGMDLSTLPTNTVCHGPVDADTADKFYANADVFCLPTLSDGFALTQLEAAAHRLPLLVSRYCAKICQHEENGLLLDPISAASIREAIEQCIKSPCVLNRWSNYELDWKKYSIQRLGESLLQMVEGNQPTFYNP